MYISASILAVTFLVASNVGAGELSRLQAESSCRFYPIGWQRMVVSGDKTFQDCQNRCRNQSVFGAGCSTQVCRTMCETQWSSADLRADDIQKKRSVPNIRWIQSNRLPFPNGSKVTIKGDIGRYMSICKDCQFMKRSSIRYTASFHHTGAPRDSETFKVVHRGNSTALLAFNGQYLAYCGGCRKHDSTPIISGTKPAAGKPFPKNALFQFRQLSNGLFIVRSSNGRYWTRYHNKVDMEKRPPPNIKSQMLASYYNKIDRDSARFEIKLVEETAASAQADNTANCSVGYFGKPCSTSLDCASGLVCQKVGSSGFVSQFIGGFVSGDTFCMVRDNQRFDSAVKNKDTATLKSIPICPKENGLGKAAVSKGIAVVWGSGTSASSIGSLSDEFGLVFGPGGEIGYYAASCAGIEFDISVSAYSTVGLYNSWSDVPGTSTVTAGSASIPFVEGSFTASQVWSADEVKLIGTQAALGIGAGFIPVAITGGRCETSVVQLVPEVRFFGTRMFRTGRPTKEQRKGQCAQQYPLDPAKRKRCEEGRCIPSGVAWDPCRLGEQRGL